MPNLFPLLRGGERCFHALFTTILVCFDHDSLFGDVDTKELEALDPLHFRPVNFNGDLFSPPFPVVHDQLLCLAHIEGEVVVLASHCQVYVLLPIGCLIIVGVQAYHCCVVSKLNDGVEVIKAGKISSL